MGFRDDGPSGSPAEALLARYRRLREEIRSAYLTVLAIA